MCSHDPFFGTNKNRILKNGSCERAFTLIKVLTGLKTKMLEKTDLNRNI